MPPLFAAAIDRLNAVVVTRLSTSYGITIDGAEIDGGILDAGYDNPTLDGMGTVGSSPKLMVQAKNVPTNPEGKQVVIASGFGAGTYKIAQAYPDGSGTVILQLM